MKRLPAEWEPQQFIQFTFPHRESDWAYMYDEVVDCFVNIINTTARFEPVLIGCHDPNEVIMYFEAMSPFPIHFAKIESEDTWARDHGAITILNNDQPVLLNFIFNGWGKKFKADLDNLITRSLFDQKIFSDAGLQSLDFVMEGGAIESDGQGTMLTTSECLLSPARNPSMSKADIEAYLKKAFGLQQVLWLDHGYLAGDDTDSHIDTLARFCSEEIIAYIACDDPADEHYEALHKMEVQLRTFRQTNGEPYRLVRLPWPDACFDKSGGRLPATYANFLIVNGAVLVPTYQVTQDEAALAVLSKCFPDRQVIGVNCRPLIEQHGSLHCITMQYPKEVNLTF